jgi:hypothetical protein
VYIASPENEAPTLTVDCFWFSLIVAVATPEPFRGRADALSAGLEIDGSAHDGLGELIHHRGCEGHVLAPP